MSATIEHPDLWGGDSHLWVNHDPANHARLARVSRSRTEARYAELAASRGWRPSRAAACPRSVLGQRCTAYAKPCLCWDRPGNGLFLDHARMWLAPSGERVLTSEPYGVTPERVAALREWCASVGLSVEVGERSPWNPGSTTLLIFARAES